MFGDMSSSFEAMFRQHALREMLRGRRFTDDASSVPLAQQHEESRRQLEDRWRRQSSEAESWPAVPIGRFARTPLSRLSPVTLSNLVPGVVHAGRYLLCRCLVTPYKIRAVATVVGDVDGDQQVRLSVYNLATDKVPGRSDDVSHYCLPKGTVLAVKEPYYKAGALDDQLFIRVDTPMDVLPITSPDHPLVAGTPWAELVRKGPGAAGLTEARQASPGDPVGPATALKAEGNAWFAAGQFVEALDAYQRGLEALWQGQEQQPQGEEPGEGAAAAQQLSLDFLNNASAACLGFQAFASAEAYAGLVLARQPGNAKALLRRARALDGMGRYSEAAAACAASIAATPSSADVSASRRLLEGLQRRAAEAERGEYDELGMYRAAAASKAPRLEGHADFVGPVCVDSIPGKGRGLVATEAVKAGALLMAVRADAVSYMEEVQTLMPSFSGPGRVNSPAQTQMNKDLPMPLLSCGRLAHRLAYLHESETGADTPPLPRRSECGYGVGGDDEEESGGAGGAAEGERAAAAAAFERAVATVQPSRRPLRRGLLHRTPEGYFGVNERTLSAISSTNTFAPDPLPSVNLTDARDAKERSQKSASAEQWTSASGVWSLPSYINHDCVGNVVRYFLGDFMFVRAARDIARGEELTHAYTDPLKPLEERRQDLSKHGFVCGCELCTEQAAWRERNPARACKVSSLLQEFEASLAPQALRAGPAAAASGNRGPALQLAKRLQALTAELDAALEGRAWRTEGMRALSALAFLRQACGDHAAAAAAYERTLEALRCWAPHGGGGGGGSGGRQAAAGSVPAAPLRATDADPLAFAEQSFVSPVTVMSMLNAATSWAQAGGRQGRQRAAAWAEAARRVWVRLYGSEGVFRERFRGPLGVLQL